MKLITRWPMSENICGCFYAFTPSLIKFRIFTPEPPSHTVTFEGADVPPELYERYQTVCKELLEVHQQLNALPLKDAVSEEEICQQCKTTS